MGRRISARCKIADFDIAARKKVRKLEDDSRLIKANNVDTIGYAVFVVVAASGLFQVDNQVMRLAQIFERLLELCGRVPVAGNQHQNGEFSAQ